MIVTPAPGDAEPLLAVLRKTFLPNRVLVVATEGAAQRAQQELVPLLDQKVARQGQATAYVCENQVCELPTPDPQVLARQLAKVTAYPP